MAQERHELQIVIDPKGEITVEVKGVKGNTCLEYVELFEKNVGRVKRKDLTSDYYAPGPEVGIVSSEKTRRRKNGAA